MCSADCEGPNALDEQRSILHDCLEKRVGGSNSSKYEATSFSSYNSRTDSNYLKATNHAAYK